MQHDDPARAPKNDATPTPSVDMNVVQDHIQQLAEKSGKIKGINKLRIDTDILEGDISTLLSSVRLIMSREASMELLKFIKFKVSSGQFSENYFRTYKKLLEEKRLKNLMNATLSDDERFEILATCVYRMLHCRPLTFYGTDDTAIFRNGESNTDHQDFINMANNPALLIDYISYSEMEFSRRIAISSFTHLYKFTGTGYTKISAYPVFIHAHSGIRLERIETPEYKKLFVNDNRNPELYKSMLREIIENYFADCNRAGAQTLKNVHVRLMPIDLTDPHYTIAGLSDKEKIITTTLTATQRDTLKSIIEQPDFAKKYPKISAIELRQSFWEDAASKIQHPLVSYKNYSADDLLAELTDPIVDSADKGSTSDTLLCINMVCSANAYAGNRIYKNSLNSIEAEFANRSNITTLFNPIINPALIPAALLNHLLIRFPSGKLSSLLEIKQALIQAANTPAAGTVTEQSVQQTERTPDASANTASKPASSVFKLNTPFFARFGSFFKLIAEIFHHVKTTLIEIINSKRKR